MIRPISVWYDGGVLWDVFNCIKKDCDSCEFRFKCYTDRKLVLQPPEAVKLWYNPKHWFTRQFDTKEFTELLKKTSSMRRTPKPTTPSPDYIEGS